MQTEAQRKAAKAARGKRRKAAGRTEAARNAAATSKEFAACVLPPKEAKPGKKRTVALKERLGELVAENQVLRKSSRGSGAAVQQNLKRAKLFNEMFVIVDYLSRQVWQLEKYEDASKDAVTNMSWVRVWLRQHLHQAEGLLYGGKINGRAEADRRMMKEWEDDVRARAAATAKAEAIAAAFLGRKSDAPRSQTKQ